MGSHHLDWTTIATAVIGLVGVCLGVGLTELARRRSRGEQFASAIFQRRLDAYEGLMALMQQGNSVAREQFGPEAPDATTRHAVISDVILPIATYCDENTLYLDEELAPHCTALFMGVEDFADLDEPERTQAIENFSRQYRETLRMLREDSGIRRVQRVFKTINKPNIDSPVIRYLRQERKKQK